MSDHFFVGFEKKKFGQDNSKSLWARFALLTDESRIDGWKKEKEVNLEPEQVDNTDPPVEVEVRNYDFEKVHDDFFNKMLSFVEICHLGHFSSQFSRQILIDGFNASFIKSKSIECEEKDDFVVYKLEKTHYSSVSREFRLLKGKLDTTSSFSSVLLMGLVSQFDAFISSLIRELAIARPHILTDSKKEYKAHEIFEFSNLDEFRDNLLEKEIGSVLRGSHLDQITWLEKMLKVPLTKGLSILPDYIEIFERRNLLAHTNCIVSEQYLKNCKTAECNICFELGDKIDISLSYIEKSTEILMEMGLRLTQTIWRVVAKGDVSEDTKAGSALLNSVFELLCHERYSVAKSILIPSLNGPYNYPDSVVECMLQINLATANMLLGENDDAVEVVDKRDWRAYEPRIRIGVAAIKGDVDLVASLISEVPDNLISSQNYLEWPVFALLRENEVFLEALEQKFGNVHVEQITL